MDALNAVAGERTGVSDGACCHPTGPAAAGRSVRNVPHATGVVGSAELPMVSLPGGRFAMGHDGPGGYAEDGEGPRHEVTLDPFAIGRTCVTNAQFAAFAEATGYLTVAEHLGTSFVFAGLLPEDAPATRGVAAAPWWREVPGASWRQPEGEGSTIDRRMDHPAVHIAWHDAMAFGAWSGCRLPTEAEWEYAARGGLEGHTFPWGDELRPGGAHRMNVFQGTFPTHDTAEDGWAGTCPADAFPPNGYGLHEMTGNVWEWCADWFSRDAYRASPTHDPRGPDDGTRRVMRGGSYLCHASYCRRYRVDARSSNTPESTAGNIGFRVARDV